MKTPLPLWNTAVLAALLAPMALLHEAVFGSGQGLIAAGSGIGVGLLLALASRIWIWDQITIIGAALAAYLLGAGAAALPQTTLFGILPTWHTIELSVMQAAFSWKDLLTLTPPVSSYIGPAILPWMTGLLGALIAGLFTLRKGNYILATIPIALVGAIGIAWSPSSAQPPLWPSMIWVVAVLTWWAWCAGQRRRSSGEEVILDPAAIAALNQGLEQHTITPQTHNANSPRLSVGTVVPIRRIIIAGLTLTLAVFLVWPVTSACPAFETRTVLRDFIEPPLDIHDYSTPLASFRHYTTDLEKQVILEVTGLPPESRMRFGVMDTYNGIVFGMSDSKDSSDGGYVRAGSILRSDMPTTEGTLATISVATNGMPGPWVPTAGIPDALIFDDTDLQEQLYFNHWTNAALTTGDFATPTTYRFHALVPPIWTQGQLREVQASSIMGTKDSRIPQGVSELARDMSAGERTDVGRAAAIARILSQSGYFSNLASQQSQPGHRSDRISRMIAADELVGDDEQYATLMALMLHSLDIPARVVMGAYPDKWPENGETIALHGFDIHAWVEVEFEGVGWATFDPTPPRDHTPQTKTNEPHSEPRPQVLPPPEPPSDPVELPPTVTDRPSENPTENSQSIRWDIIGAVAGAIGVVGAPIVAIWFFKKRRTRKRMSAEPKLAVRGAWDDIVDIAIDEGIALPLNMTRNETASLLHNRWYASDSELELPKLAKQVDYAVFSIAPISETEADTAWIAHTTIVKQILRSENRWKRILRMLSLRSISRNRRLHKKAGRQT